MEERVGRGEEDVNLNERFDGSTKGLLRVLSGQSIIPKEKNIPKKKNLIQKLFY